MRIYSNIAKVEPQEDGTLRVYGYASTPARDAHGEIVTAMAMEKAIDDYLKFPALREMHDATKAAGRTLELSLDDKNRTQMVAHVVDPVAIAKIKNKVYSGFSIGGRVKTRSSDDPSIITRIDLQEISLVDRPSCPEATLDLWKRDGGNQQEKKMAGEPLYRRKPDGTFELVKASDDGEGSQDGFVDKERWDDGFDGEGSDTPRGKVPIQQSDDGGAARDGGFVDSGEWFDGKEFGGQGGDPGHGVFETDPNAGRNMVSGVPNSTVDTQRRPVRQPVEVGAQDRGEHGGVTTLKSLFTGEKEGDNVNRVLDMLQTMYGIEIQKRTFTADQRRRAASSGAAMRDGSFPIENKGDLANAIRAIGRSKNPSAAKAHIKARAKALGASGMLPDTWKAAEGGAVSGQNHSNGQATEVEKAASKADELLNDVIAAMDNLEVRQRRGPKTTEESLRLAKVYKSMPEIELAEVLANDVITKVSSGDERLAKAEDELGKVKAENAMLLQKLADTNAGLAKLSDRVKKLAEQPMPSKTAGSVHALAKTDDVAGGAGPGNPDVAVSDEDVRKLMESFNRMPEEERALLLTKASLRHPRHMNLDPVASPPRSMGGTAGRDGLR